MHRGGLMKGRRKGLQKTMNNLLGIMNMFVILMVVMVLFMYTCQKASPNLLQTDGNIPCLILSK